MRVSIVHPYLETRDSHREEPLGAEYLAAIALAQGHQVQIVDGYAYTLDEAGLYERVTSFTPDLLAVSVPMSPQFPDGADLARHLRATFPQVTICFGGNYPTFACSELIREPWVDYIVLNEGERSFAALLEALADGKGAEDIADITGVVCREALSAEMEPFPLIEDLDSLPLPARHLTPEYGRIYDVASIVASRGCPYTCVNCSTTEMWQKRRRTRSVANVISEIEHLVASYPQRVLNFVDDLFTADRRWMHAFCDAYEQVWHDTRMIWMCNTRVDNLNQELLQHMGASGCRSLFLGVESGSERVLKEIGKRYDNDRVLELLQVCLKSQIQANVALMMGLPWETKEDLQATIDLARRIVTEAPSTIVNVRPVTPILGTPLYHQAAQYGIVIHRDDQFHLELKEPRISTKHLSRRDLAAALMDCKIVLSRAGSGISTQEVAR